MRPVSVVCLVLACLGLASGSPAALTVWGSGSFLSGAAEAKTVHAVRALEELFTRLAGLGSGEPVALHGLLDTQQLAEQRPDAVVVVVSPAGQASPAVQQKLEELTGSAASYLQLPNALDESSSHPVFAGLRSAARKLHIKVVGDCQGVADPARAEEAVSGEALRQRLEGAAGGDKPTVVVLCPAAGSPEAEAALLAEAQQALAELAPKHLLVHLARAGAAAAAGTEEQQEARRRLLSTVGVTSGSSAANRTNNYTTCDATCRKHVMFMEGLIILVVILIALTVGCCCMHIINVPTRFAQPEGSRQHND